MRYVIMANGKGSRWNRYRGIPKHLIEVEGETLLARTTRLVRQQDQDAEVIITSGDPSYEVEGALRHKPEHGEREIDRFCYELICDDVCFLYGDTLYTPEAIRQICDLSTGGILFFGTDKAIVGVKAHDATVLKRLLNSLIDMIDMGVIPDAKGWQLYHLHQGMPLEGRAIKEGFIRVDEAVMDFNTHNDFDSFEKMNQNINLSI